MTKLNPELAQAAYQLASEIRDGCWRHLPDLKNKPAPSIPELIQEIGRRCPGFSVPEYQRALADGLIESR
jgi:hypothetical protein